MLCRSQASTARWRWFGKNRQRLAYVEAHRASFPNTVHAGVGVPDVLALCNARPLLTWAELETAAPEITALGHRYGDNEVALRWPGRG
jgi:hypothetical protein